MTALRWKRQHRPGRTRTSHGADINGPHLILCRGEGWHIFSACSRGALLKAVVLLHIRGCWACYLGMAHVSFPRVLSAFLWGLTGILAIILLGIINSRNLHITALL